MKILFIRHGQTQHNAEGKYIGSIDSPLCDIGIDELIQKKTIMEKYNQVEKLYSSPMKRCLETAEIYFEDMKPVIIENLRERNFGIFEGKTHKELKNNIYYNEFVSSIWKTKVPEAEEAENFFKRTDEAYFIVLEDMKKRNISYSAIVCHGGVIMSIFSRYEDRKLGFYDYMLSNGEGYLTEIDSKTKSIKTIEKI